MLFEIFCIDNKNKLKFRDTKKFIDALSFNENLWKSPDLVKDTTNFTLTDEVQGISIKIETIDTSKVVTDDFTSVAFVLKINGEYENIEPLRLKFIQHLRELGFAHIRVLNDDASHKLGMEIYPHINKIENLLRRYLVKFFITRVGTSWWELKSIIPDEFRDKVKMRKDNKDNELYRNQAINLINTDVHWIDFNELGDILTKQTSAFSKVEDVIKRIESTTDLESLKKEITGTYPKYFKDFFGKTNFSIKWESLFEIRNRVSHNNYLFQKDLDTASRLVTELEEIIQNAEKEVDTVYLDIAQKEALNQDLSASIQENKPSSLQDSIKSEESVIPPISEQLRSEVEKSYEESKNAFKSITEEEFLYELEQFTTHNPSMSFVGLRHFIYEFLGRKGYAYRSTYTIINILKDKGKIKFDEVDNPYGHYPTTTISLQDD